MTRAQHVIPRENGWAVKAEGARRASGVYDRRTTAVQRAKRIARNTDAQVIVHREDGTIENVLEPQKTSQMPKEAGVRRAVHVEPREEGWVITREGRDAVIVRKATRYGAVTEGHRRASDSDSALVVHRRDGTSKRFDHPSNMPAPIAALFEM